MKLEEIRMLCEAATPGPWYVPSDKDWPKFPFEESSDSYGMFTEETPEGFVFSTQHARCAADAAFIAAARDLVPKLLAVAEAAHYFVRCPTDERHMIEEGLVECLDALESAP